MKNNKKGISLIIIIFSVIIVLVCATGLVIFLNKSNDNTNANNETENQINNQQNAEKEEVSQESKYTKEYLLSLPESPIEDFDYETINDDTEMWITGYNGSDEIIVIPNEIEGKKVTRLGAANSWSSIDHGNTTCKAVVLNKDLKIVGAKSFYNWDINTILFNDGLEKIYSDSFTSTNIEILEIPDSVTNIGELAFSSTKNLKKIKFPNNKTCEYGASCFAYSGIEEVIFPANLKSDYVLFISCNNLKKIVIEDGNTYINDFYLCNSIEEITIPASVTKINKSIVSGYNVGIGEITEDDAYTNSLLIKCEKGSYAEQFANENNLKIEYIK